MSGPLGIPNCQLWLDAQQATGVGFPLTGIFDDFDRPDENPVAGPWVDVQGFAVVSNQAVAQPGFPMALRGPDEADNIDYEIYCDVVSWGDGQRIDLVLHQAIYGAVFSPTNVFLYSDVGIVTAPVPYAVPAGSSVGVRLIGTTLSAWVRTTGASSWRMILSSDIATLDHGQAPHTSGLTMVTIACSDSAVGTVIDNVGAGQPTFADGDNVEFWADLSDNESPLGNTDVPTQPVFRKGRLNGYPSVYFPPDRTAILTALSLPQTQPASGEATTFLVFRNSPDADWATWFTSGGTSPFIGTGSFYARAWGWSFGGTGPTQFIASTAGTLLGLQADPTAVQIFSQIADPTGERVLIDGKLIGSDSVPFIADGTGGVILNVTADLGELILYDRVLSDYEHARVVEYLQKKWFPQSPQLPSGSRDSEAVLRSLRAYTAQALGDEWEVRLSREEGAFKRPFARVVQAGTASSPTSTGVFLADMIQPFVIYAYPPAGTTPDQALVIAQEVENALFRAFRVGVGHGRPLRIPLLNYVKSPVGDGTTPDVAGVWYPKDYVRVHDFSTQPVADTDENTLWTVTASLRLGWRRTTMPSSTGSLLTSVLPPVRTP